MSASENKAHLVLDKYLDASQVEKLRARFHDLLRDECSTFVLDFSQTQFVCSGILGLLVEFKKAVRARKGKVQLANLGPNVEKLLRETKILDLFNQTTGRQDHGILETFEAIQEHSSQELLFLSLINQIASTVLMEGQDDSIHQEILIAVAQALKPRSASLFLVEETPAGPALNLTASENVTDKVLGRLRQIPLREDTLEYDCLFSRTTREFSISAKEAKSSSPLLEAAGVRQGILEPIAGTGKSLGLILIETPERPSSYFTQSIPALQVFANMCGLAIEKRTLLEDIRLKNAHLLKTLDELSRMQDTLMEAGKLAVIGALTRGLCHALNNKLVPILGYAQIMGIRLDPASPEAAKMKIIEDSAFDIKKILDNMHSLATSTSMPFQSRDVREIIAACLQMQDYLFRENNIVVEWNSTPCDCVLPVHRERLVQAFLALIHRLPKAYEGVSSPRRFGISLVREGDYLTIYFEDNGRVISLEELKMLEKPFDYGNPFEDERLNFNIARSVIKDHQGILEIYSSEDTGGTRVVMRLPLPEYIPAMPALNQSAVPNSK